MQTSDMILKSSFKTEKSQNSQDKDSFRSDSESLSSRESDKIVVSKIHVKPKKQ